MFPNLEAELAREKISAKDFAQLIGTSSKTANNKKQGRTEFTLSEIQAISDRFPELSIDYLFAKQKEAKK